VVMDERIRQGRLPCDFRSLPRYRDYVMESHDSYYDLDEPPFVDVRKEWSSFWLVFNCTFLGFTCGVLTTVLMYRL